MGPEGAPSTLRVHVRTGVPPVRARALRARVYEYYVVVRVTPP